MGSTVLQKLICELNSNPVKDSDRPPVIDFVSALIAKNIRGFGWSGHLSHDVYFTDQAREQEKKGWNE